MTTPGQPLSKSEPLTQQVARNIRNAIEAGTLRHGQILASTRELAQEWGVSVFTINEAMKMLIGEGIVVSKSRSKRMVNHPDGEPEHRMAQSAVPRVVFVGGYAGSGKSEFGRILARETGWPILDKDTLTRPVVEMALEALGLSPHDRESETYLGTVRPREYEALVSATNENVDCGLSAVVTAPFLREFRDDAWLERTVAALADRGAAVTFVWIHCDEDTMRTYVRHRGAARDSAKMADWSSYLDGIDVDFRPPVPHVVVENSASSAPLKVQATKLIESFADPS